MLVSAKNIIQFSGGFRPSDKGGGEAVSKKKKKMFGPHLSLV